MQNRQEMQTPNRLYFRKEEVNARLFMNKLTQCDTSLVF